MEKHPGLEKLELLQAGNLRGAELLEILRHLENCNFCYQNLPPQDPTEVLNRLLKVDEGAVENRQNSKIKPKF